MRGEKGNSKLSKPIVVISLSSIILGVAIMLITVSVITAFQDGIRDKVIGFGSHIRITKSGLNKSMESAPINIDQDFYPELEQEEAIKKIQPFAYKPAILQAFRDTIAFELQEGDTTQSGNEILGVLFKGVDENYDWSFFEDKIIDGRLISFDGDNDEILLSHYIANLMGYQIGDRCDAFFIRDNSGPKKKKFTIVGIYDSGFEEFDKQFIFTQINHIQSLNNWGVKTFVTIADTCINGRFALEAIISGGTQSYQYDWGRGYQRSKYYLLSENDQKIRVIATDFNLNPFGPGDQQQSIPDTAFIEATMNKNCPCNAENLKSIQYDSPTLMKGTFGSVKIRNGNGTEHLYVGGFEVIINNWEDLETAELLVQNKVPYELKTTSIKEMHRDIFSWLDLLDMNILIIITLILIVSLINMITSLLVLILEKTNMIGILKAIGGKNSSIRCIFIFHALFLLSRGLLWGNILGIGLLLIQYYTGIITLNAEVYSLDTVPVSFNIGHILAINALTILICFVILILPSYLVTKIKPVKAIRFD